MSTFRPVVDGFAVAPQLSLEDLDRASAEGFRVIVCNRPDAEAPENAQADAIRRRAEDLGLAFVEAPFAGPPTFEAVDALEVLFARAPGPILAYCRSGTRSITAWAFAQARSGARSAESIVAAAEAAGYDLRHLTETLRSLSEKAHG